MAINTEPVTNKVFKTISLEGTDSWGATFVSELQSTGFIEATFFEQKESDWFAYLRNQGVVNINTPTEAAQEFPLRSANGIGNTNTIQTLSGYVLLNFPLTLPIGNIPSVGDSVYFAVPVTFPTELTPIYIGYIYTITVDIPNSENFLQVLIDTAGGGVAPTASRNYIMTTKNLVAESHGILGHYGVFTLTNSSTEAVELFAVKSEVMKSYP